jgi:hypothetical protein
VNLHAMLRDRAAEGRPIRVGLASPSPPRSGGEGRGEGAAPTAFYLPTA